MTKPKTDKQHATTNNGHADDGFELSTKEALGPLLDVPGDAAHFECASVLFQQRNGQVGGVTQRGQTQRQDQHGRYTFHGLRGHDQQQQPNNAQIRGISLAPRGHL